MKKFKSLFLLTTFILFSCSTEDDNLIVEQDLELKKNEFINLNSYLFKDLDDNTISIFKNSIEFNEKGDLSTFKYDILENKLSDKEFKNVLIEFYKNKNVSKILFVNNDNIETLFESPNNDELNARDYGEEVYLIKDKKNHRRGGCSPKNGWVCEIRVSKDAQVILV